MELNFTNKSIEDLEKELKIINNDYLDCYYKEEEVRLFKEKNITPYENILNNQYYQAKKIIIKMSRPEFGLGVFATEDIKKDELIERCPLIELSWRFRYIGDPVLRKYVYTNGGCPCEECKKHGPKAYLLAGYGMIFNHQDIPNTKWMFNFKNVYSDLLAKRDIKKGEEIFVTYGPTYFSQYQHTQIKR